MADKKKVTLDVQCVVDKSLLRDVNNKPRTNSLFVEKPGTQTDCTNAPYTLKKYPFKDRLSMYQLYMDSGTEYEAAMRILGDWKHWEYLTKAKFFQPYITEWREERRVREEALAHKTLLEQTKSGSVTAANSIKAKPKGRPSKGEVKKAAMEQAAHDNIIELARKRLSAKGK